MQNSENHVTTESSNHPVENVGSDTQSTQSMSSKTCEFLSLSQNAGVSSSTGNRTGPNSTALSVSQPSSSTTCQPDASQPSTSMCNGFSDSVNNSEAGQLDDSRMDVADTQLVCNGALDSQYNSMPDEESHDQVQGNLSTSDTTMTQGITNAHPSRLDLSAPGTSEDKTVKRVSFAAAPTTPPFQADVIDPIPIQSPPEVSLSQAGLGSVDSDALSENLHQVD